jgi:hypothetical protein
MEGVSGRLILVGQLWRFWGEIRDRRNSTIEDVRKTFELAKEKPNNPGLAGDFYRESLGTANAAEISKNREQDSKPDSETLQIQAKLDALEE